MRIQAVMPSRLCLACAILSAVCSGMFVQADAVRYRSPMEMIAAADGTLIVAEHTGHSLAFVSLSGETPAIARLDLPGAPTGIARQPGSDLLVVTAGAEKGSVYIVTADRKILSHIAAGHTPMAPTFSGDGKTLYVCARFNNAILAIDLEKGEVVRSIPVLREPVAAAMAPDGKKLFVANHLPITPSDGDYVAAVISVIDVEQGEVTDEIELPNGSTALRGMSLSPDGAFIYVTHILARYHLPTTQLERGWMNTNALTIIDTAAAERVNTVLLDDVDLGAANPWGVACSADGAFLCVAQAGAQDVSVIDRPALHDKLRRVAEGERVSDVSGRPEDVPNDLSFLVGIRRRVGVTGNGPRGIAVVGAMAYVAEYYTDSIGEIGLDAGAFHRTRSIALADEQPMTLARKGEMYFNDANLCFQKWQSCASCHPDARADGLNWDLLNDGIGNPKNTKSMLLAHQTPPAMVSGIRGSAEVAVRAGIRFIQFAVRPEEDAVAIDEYLKALRPEVSPWLVDGEMTESARRGEQLYEEAGCHHCHPAPLYTDLELYNVGTGLGRETDMEFDTPALVEVWRTAPYLHDGRAATMMSVLVEHNPDDQHGDTTRLTEQELEDLVAYIMTR